MTPRGTTTLLLFVLAGCGGPGSTGSKDPGTPPAPDEDRGPEAEFFTEMKHGDDQLAALCARNHRDKVAQGLCSKPVVRSLADLQRAVGLFDQGAPQFALTGHSTSLVERSVSAINPRAIIFTAPSMAPTTQTNDGRFVADPGLVTMGFVRGDQVVELAAHDAQKNELHFYLVRFTQACNKTGCSNADLLTSSIERDWNGISVYEDQDLTNTTFDCTHCHQPDGPSARKLLRMQERRAPWTHWFRNNRNEPGGIALVQDFQRAHGTAEDYAGIPAALLDTPRSDPLVFEALVDNNSVSPQPNEFQTGRIETEVKNSAPRQPAENVPMGQSGSWNQIFNRAIAGQAIPVPYHDVKVTDPGKLASLADAYRAVLEERSPRASLPDIREVFLADAEAEMGLRPAPGLDGRGILVQTCAQCHNAKTDRSLTRANFDVSLLDSMSRDQKDKAVMRLNQPHESTKLMPPRRFARLSPEEIAAATAELRK
jgi:hypothetical protein